jgi:hypothetical protein
MTSHNWIHQILADVLSDVILISTPIMLIMGVKLSRSERTRIIAVFSTSAIVTVVCINHAYWVIKYGGIREAQAAVIQVCSLASSGPLSRRRH